ncbi:MAG: hypothetical protein QM756_36815 [Polyangiaceae bacterium]
MGRTGSVWVVGLLALSAAGCHEHVGLNAPAAQAPFDERVDAYKGLRPLSLHETHITYLQGGVPVGASRQTDYLQIANGRRVYYPEDILPVVDSASPSALAAQESESARSTGNTLMAVAGGGYVLGLGVMLYPVLQTREPGEGINTTPLILGAGIAIASSIVYLVGRSFHSSANDEAATAFETYDDGLRKRLRLCREGNQVNDCP